MAQEDGTSGANRFVEALESYDVPYVFGNPGTTELPLIEAVSASNSCEYVMTLQEDIAVGMAAGFAKTRTYHSHTDESVNPLGVVNLHAAPGLAHGLGNLHGASYAGAPILVTAGIQSRGFQHEEPILSGDMVEMTRQFTKWSAMVNDVDALPAMTRRAVRTALTPPTGPVFLGFPLDVLNEETDAPIEPLGTIPEAGRGNRAQIQDAASLLADATEPVMITGDGIARSGREAVDAAVELAEASGTRVHGEILAAEVSFPGTHELWHSFIPPSESTARNHMDTDTLLLVGCSTNTTITAYESPLISDDTTVIHVSADPSEVGKTTRADAAVVGDPGDVLTEMAQLVRDEVGDEERIRRKERVQEYIERTNGATESTTGDEDFATRATFVDNLREAAPDANLVDESITTKYVLIERWPLEPEQFLSTKGGGLGYGLPSAVGAAFAEDLRSEPEDVVGVIGDGSFLYYPNSLYTAARYGVDLTIVIPDNRSYAVLKQNTVDVVGGDSADHDFKGMGIEMEPAVDIGQMAESQGVSQWFVEDPDHITPSVREAVETPGPSLVDVLIQD
ncbi:thiamine pyrophosphate-binding protein [Haloarchaeobius salinus]|uniref:thiamine pyrophosphate-binding protein n=1 Tax=Haloarchaeobius salinus TaxID=1198298 RepID=UPI00210E6D87|nr:thiamine pyrophosphate-binding protein [Haloarchaeobius salinus]